MATKPKQLKQSEMATKPRQLKQSEMEKPQRLKQSYVVWNNKGGAGKTTLVFHLATHYARKNPETRVVVIDMCPQANVSMALLTEREKNGRGLSGEDVVQGIMRSKVNGIYEKTVCGFLTAMVEKDQVDFTKFLTKASVHNKYVSGNIRVLCGDRYLEILSKRLDQERRMSTLVRENPWKKVTLFLKHFIYYVCDKEKEFDFMFFIDTNPTFSVYTELAVSAATRMIVPVNADDFSKAAVDAMVYLIYGISSNPDPRSNLLEKEEYRWIAQQNETKIDLPKIHLVIHNKTTTYKLRSSMAFEAKNDTIKELLNQLFDEHQEIFSETDPEQPGQFNPSKYTCDLKDFHSQAVLSLQTGCPLAITHGTFHLEGGKEVKQKDDKKAEQILDEIIGKL